MRGFRFHLATIVVLATLVSARDARAIRFGQNDAVELRGHFYTQYTVATEQSQEYTQPSIDPGNMKQWRNFYNPELEVDFRKLTGGAAASSTSSPGGSRSGAFTTGSTTSAPSATSRRST